MGNKEKIIVEYSDKSTSLPFDALLFEHFGFFEHVVYSKNENLSERQWVRTRNNIILIRMLILCTDCKL